MGIGIKGDVCCGRVGFIRWRKDLVPSYVVKNAPADWSRKRKKWEKTKCQQKVCFLLGKETGGGGI